jgi:hypothetical protein
MQPACQRNACPHAAVCIAPASCANDRCWVTDPQNTDHAMPMHRHGCCIGSKSWDSCSLDLASRDAVAEATMLFPGVPRNAMSTIRSGPEGDSIGHDISRVRFGRGRSA